MRGRDESAVADLAAAYKPRIVQLAYRHTRNHLDAEEIAQDVLLMVYHKIGSFRGDAALSSWIYRIAFNATMSRLRKQRAARRSIVQISTVGHPPAHAGSGDTVVEAADRSAPADEQLLQAQLRRELRKALCDLPEIYRAPVVLRDLHGLSTEQASAHLRVKSQTLKSRLHRGRLLLRRRLLDFATGLTLHRPQPAVRPVPAFAATT